MPYFENRRARLYYETSGQGDPMILVHGSWDSHHVWQLVIPQLAESCRVVSYDRRGHADSSAPAGQGSIYDDIADLAALIQEVGSPAHVVASSFGAAISLAWQRVSPSSSAASRDMSRPSWVC